MTDCDCGTRFVREHPEFVLEAARRLRQVGANGPYTTLWHAPDCPKRGDTPMSDREKFKRGGPIPADGAPIYVTGCDGHIIPRSELPDEDFDALRRVLQRLNESPGDEID